MKGHNQFWELREIGEALADELERLHQVSRVRAMGRRKLYTVDDLEISMNVFANYDGDRVRFRTAEPGEQGASTLNLSLGSITDKVVAETTAPAVDSSQTPLEELAPGAKLKPEQTRRLRRFGVDTAEDLQRLGKQNVQVDGIDFADLARRMEAASRPRRRPRPNRVVKFRHPSGTLSYAVYGSDLDEVRMDTVRLDGQSVPAQIVAGTLSFDGWEDARMLEFETLGVERLCLRLR